MLESLDSGLVLSDTGMAGRRESSYSVRGWKGSTTFLAAKVGLDGSGVVADEDPDDPGEDDENARMSSPLSEDVFDEGKLDDVEIIVAVVSW